jgi:long-chain acyl-CoA synthetase
MLYSSGTTGRPKGILRPLPEQPPAQKLPVYDAVMNLWRCREGMIFLSPAPLYHVAPHAGVAFAIHLGGTAIIMEHFDAEQFLRLVERYRVTHTQLVPTMFSRMLKLPEEARRRHDLSSLEVVFHGAAPCPVQIKEQMIEWWGPIIFEYYGMTEAMGLASGCDSKWRQYPKSPEWGWNPVLRRYPPSRRGPKGHVLSFRHPTTLCGR